MMQLIYQIYDKFVLVYPKTVLVVFLILICLLGYQARKLEVDASAETLIVEGDQDLKFTRQVNERFGNNDILFATYAPKLPLLSDENLDNLKNLQDDLEKLDAVESVFSILNVPLLQSPPQPVTDLMKDVPALGTHQVNRELAEEEFLNSPIYREMLVNQDFNATVLQINLRDDVTFDNFIKQRDVLREKLNNNTITTQETAEFKQLRTDFKLYRDQIRVIDQNNLKAIRLVLDKYREADGATIFLGGVSMITNDMVTFLKNDLRFFGLGVLIFMIIVLKLIFKQIRWVLLPIFCCAFSVLATCGILGFFGWEVTVISSNFISIQIIITMAVAIHLTVRYRELLEEAKLDQRSLVLETVSSMFKPCLFATLTTITGFASLTLGDLLPVINFGRMMSIGVGISLIVTFLIFPIMMFFLPKTTLEKKIAVSSISFTHALAQVTDKQGKWIVAFSIVSAILIVFGMKRLLVENSFIDYFKSSTEIYQGMKFLDQELGGTTPLDIVIDFNDEGQATDLNIETGDEQTEKDEFGEEFDEFGDLEEEFENVQNQAPYWFTPEKMAVIEKVHDYLEGIPEVGKVLSLGTMLKVGRLINDGKSLDGLALALIYQELPERFRKIILSPYVSIENNQVRFSLRIIDSNPDLRRDALLNNIRDDLVQKLDIDQDAIRLAGVMVLYNNMLQSLFDSQILTIGTVILVLMVMFLILFRSLVLSMIAIVPNVLSVGAVLGFMGWAKIPLDLMTITIASISVGIAVDDTIHYIHRFKKEFAIDGNYIKAMYRSHESIGYAMYYTSITIIIGFSILVTSNFIPSIYFGILTGLAMFIALIASLTLLPQLIILLKPFGKSRV